MNFDLVVGKLATYGMRYFLKAAYIIFFVSICSPLSVKAEIKVGISAPLTGDLAEYGTAVRQGIELAASEQPPAFKEIKFVFEDNQYEGSKAVSAFQKLKTIDSVDLIYNWGEPTLHAIAPLAETQRLPVMAMSLDPLPALGKKYVLRSINHSDQYAEKLIEHLRGRGYKNIAILKTEDPFLNSMVGGLKKHLRAGELVEVFATFTPEDQDFKTQISRLKTHKFDVIGIYLFTGQISQFYRQAQALSFAAPTFGTDFFESKTEITQAQGGMKGAVYPNIDVSKTFAKDYRKRFGNDAQIAYAYNAYVFAKLTANLFGSNNEKLSADEIIKRYANPPSNLGFRFVETKEGGRFYEFPLVIKQVVENEIKLAP